jgi:hypothetical protein
MTFTIGPREDESTSRREAWRHHPAYTQEFFTRTINGTKYAFGRTHWDNGKVSVQVLKVGAFKRGGPIDEHYFESTPTDA